MHKPQAHRSGVAAGAAVVAIAIAFIINVLLVPNSALNNIAHAEAQDQGDAYREGLRELRAGNHHAAASNFSQACDAGSVEGCSGLGVLYQNGLGVPQDYAIAASLYRRACDGEHMASCHNLGILYASGDGVAQDASRAAQLLNRACEGTTLRNGFGRSCFALGVMHETGQGALQDALRAAQFYDRACAREQPEACERRVPVLQRACDAGTMSTCTDLGVLYEFGRNVPHDYDRAAQLFHRACDGGEMSGCYHLGVRYERGHSGIFDIEMAEGFHRRACEGGYGDSCSRLRLILD